MGYDKRSFNVRSLRVLPYNYLFKAAVSFVMFIMMVISIIAKRSFGAAYSGNIIYQIADVGMTVTYIIIIVCLHMIEALSNKFNKAMRMFVGVGILYFTTMVTTSIEVFLLAEELSDLAITVDWITCFLTLAKVLLYAAGTMQVLEGMDDALKRLPDQHDVPGLVSIGRIYVALSLISLIITGIIEIVGSDYAWYVVGLSSLTSFIVEVIVFISSRRAAFEIWRGYTGGADERV